MAGQESKNIDGELVQSAKDLLNLEAAITEADLKNSEAAGAADALIEFYKARLRQNQELNLKEKATPKPFGSR